MRLKEKPNATVVSSPVIQGSRFRDHAKRLVAVFKCQCGVNFIGTASEVISGRLKSCGCLRGAPVMVDGVRSVSHPLYPTWTNMIRRCHAPNASRYERYGGRGIKVCKRWRESFAAFVSDMGARPEGCQIDRIDNDGDYEPSNCHWASVRSNVRNSTKTKLTECQVREIRENAEMATPAQLAEQYSVSRSAIYSILRNENWKDIQIGGAK